MPVTIRDQVRNNPLCFQNFYAVKRDFNNPFLYHNIKAKRTELENGT